MKVFISHKSEDINRANTFAQHLEEMGFEIYFDAYDPEIVITEDRAQYIQEQIETSTDLLVIITEHTKLSWWVPFEIGLSTANDVRIASILDSDARIFLPSFLRKWPVIDSDRKYEIYLQELKTSNRKLQEIQSTFSSDMESFNELFEPTRISESFHKTLLRKFSMI